MTAAKKSEIKKCREQLIGDLAYCQTVFLDESPNVDYVR